MIATHRHRLYTDPSARIRIFYLQYTFNVWHGFLNVSIPFSAPLSSTITPATQVIDSGETATFNCTVQGNPIKMVEWFKDGELLADDDRIIYQSSTLLYINDVQRKDQGMYQCFITDGKEEVQGTSQLLLGG